MSNSVLVTDRSLGVNTLWVFDQSMVYNCNILDKGAKFPKIELCCIVDDVKCPCHSKEFLKLRFVALFIFPFLWKRANTEIASFRNSLRWQIYIINPFDQNQIIF